MAADEAEYSDSELELDAASSGISSLSAQTQRPSTPRFGIRCRPVDVRSKSESTCMPSKIAINVLFLVPQYPG